MITVIVFKDHQEVFGRVIDHNSTEKSILSYPFDNYYIITKSYPNLRIVIVSKIVPIVNYNDSVVIQRLG